MKLSKIDHTRSGIGIKKNGAIGGILYNDPNKTKGIQNLEGRLANLSRKSSHLYGFFNPIQKGNEPIRPNEEDYDNKEIFKAKLENYHIKRVNYLRREAYEKELPFLNRSLKDVFFPESNNKKLVTDMETIISGLKNCKYKSKFPNEYNPTEIKANEVVEAALRNSLSKVKREAVVVLQCIAKKNITEEEKKAIGIFTKELERDYKKLNDPQSKGKYVRSIENQNMVVQMVNDEIVLPIPSKAGKSDKKLDDYKERERDGFNKFLLLYANLNDEDRHDSLRKIRRILEIFFEAPTDYYKYDSNKKKEYAESVMMSVDSTLFNVWEKHENGKNTVGTFVPVPEELKTEGTIKKILDSVKAKSIKEKIDELIHIRNMDGYQFARTLTGLDNGTLFFEDYNINLFWIHHIENAIERILDKKITENIFKLNNGYLKEKIWKDIINTICIKYTAIGKAVYNFGMNDVLEDKESISLGTFDAINGLNSFDYEMIKAGESLQRDLQVSVTFASNNLARAVLKSGINEDVLTLSRNQREEKDDGTKIYRDVFKESINGNSDLERDILQFFGGKSKWDTEWFKNAYQKTDEYMVEFLDEIRRIIYALRNESFHFKTFKIDEGNWNTKLIGGMFKKETEVCLSLERDKFYSNNLPMFYSPQKLENVLNALYKKTVIRNSQVPSFNAIVVRKKLPDFIKQVLKYTQIPSMQPNELDKWYSACYYLFKEIYYNDFLKSSDARNLFVSEVYKLEPKGIESGEREKSSRAIADFQDRITELENYSLSEICQYIMTEYNLQNNQTPKVKPGKANPLDKEIFKHYKMLLLMSLNKAFGNFIKSKEIYSFVETPEIREMPKKETFLTDWKSEKYKKLVDEVSANPQLQKWYVTCRFLNGKTINLLLGSMREYISYTNNIRKRAQETGNTIHKELGYSNAGIEKRIEIVEICGLLSGVISNEFSDYFKNENDYALYLSKFVDIGNVETDISPYNTLLSFCNDLPATDRIFADEKKPIVNKNIIYAKLFGPASVLEKALPRINRDDFDIYSNASTGILKYKNKGTCANKDEQKALINYQRIKNKVELRDLTEYGELINELLGQLVNWSYLRERDLLYYQLGFHYMCLHNNSDKPEGYTLINTKDGRAINNAILNQILSIYVNGVKAYVLSEEGIFCHEKPEGKSIGAKAEVFGKYEKSIGLKKDYIYLAGLELFEKIPEHNDIVNLRNSIDHFKYYKGDTGSLLDLYSEIFDRFFTYDMKYQKNVVNLLENILLRHKIVIEPIFANFEREVSIDIKKTDKKAMKKRAQIGIGRAYADTFTYDLRDKNEKRIQLAARDNDFIANVINILYYPQKASENCVVNVTHASKNKTDDNIKGNYNRGYKNNYDKGSGKDYKFQEQKSDGLSSSLGDILKNIKL